jgi:RNA polymerase sigma-B factor
MTTVRTEPSTTAGDEAQGGVPLRTRAAGAGMHERSSAGLWEDAESAFAAYARTRDRELRAQLVASQLPLASRLALRFRNRGMAVEDLEQVAALALIKAIDRYDPARGTAFATYAVPTIVGELKRHFRDRSWSIRVPRALKDRWVTVMAGTSDLTQELGRTPTVREVAERAGVGEEDVLEALDAATSFHPQSIYADHDTEGPSGGERDFLAVEDDVMTRANDRDELRRMMLALDERERRIVYLRFFQELTQAEIAARVGISQMHVSRLLQRSLVKLRAAATEVGVGACSGDHPRSA